MSIKRNRGQYYTITNPFDTVAFYRWIENIPDDIKAGTILEPFAGSNNIPAMLTSSSILVSSWACYDIDPPKINNFKAAPVRKQDTLANFPKGYAVCVTNPPYLSKNSATRRGLTYPDTIYDDLYKLCLNKMLENVDYIAAIVPETFITSGLFHDRLHSVVSLTCKMFDDTDCPVCLAMFSPEKSSDFVVYEMNERLGSFKELSKGLIKSTSAFNWTINDPAGSIGIVCIDNTKGQSIRFCKGTEIDPRKVKFTSRSITRVSGLPEGIDIDAFIDRCNAILDDYRNKTRDVFLASFKGLRADGKYRRRLDFGTAKEIMNKAMLGGARK